MKDGVEKIYFHIADKVREKRLSRNLSQLELAALTGITRSMIASIEAGNTRIMVHHVYAIARAFGCSVEDFIPF